MDAARVRFTARLRLEPINARHAQDLWRLFRDPAVAEWYGEWTFEMAQREATRIAEAWATDGVHKWMAYDRLTGALVGRGGLSRASVDGKERLEIGWALLHERWGHGYATEIGQAGLDFAFDELDADEVVSFTEARNNRSRAVMERLGFSYAHDFVLEQGGEPFALYLLSRPDDPRDRQPQIENDQQFAGYYLGLEKLNVIMAGREDTLFASRDDPHTLEAARHALYRIYRRRQGVLDAIEAYEHKYAAR